MKAALLLLTMLQSVDLFPVTKQEEKPAAKEADRYLVVFTASWCGPCKQWKANERPKLQGVSITTVDIDEQRQWGIDRVPAFWIVDQETRKPIKKLTGYRAADELLQEVNSVAEKPAQPDGQAGGPIGSDERTKLIDHLLNDGIHAGRHTRAKLEAMSLENLETLHTLEHNSGPKWYVQPKQTVRRRRGLFFDWGN